MAATDSPPPFSTHALSRIVEWPTLVLIVACYGGWLALTHSYGTWPVWVVAPCLAVLLTFHSSLQHEILHGHPTRSAAVNRLFGIVPLTLWIPYDRYRVQHLVHHINDRLTDPIDDPESCYWTPEGWAALSSFEQRIVHWQQTLAGRIVVGPWWRTARFLISEGRAFAQNEPGVRVVWIVHLLLCVPVLYWVKVVCGIPIWVYVVAMVYPGNGLLLVRSYAEHRARPTMFERTAIVEDSRLLGPLYLFNNLHSLHHAEPLLPWYRYNVRYAQTRAQLVRDNGGLVYRTYFDVARRFLFTEHDRLVHPTGRVPARVPSQHRRFAQGVAGEA